MKAFAALALAVVLAGCSDSRPLSKLSLGAGPLGNADLVKYVGKEIPDRAKVSAFDLDEIDMRVDAFRVGLVSFLSGDAPQVDFMIPQNADYVELLRCREDASAIQELLNLDIGVASAEAVVRRMRTTDYWQQASGSQSCLLLSPSVSKNGFFDASAPSGSWRYLARACVEQNRLLDTATLGTRNCSRVIGVSSSLPNHQNLRALKENEALDAMRKAMARADAIGRQIFFQTVEYNNAIVGCQKITAENNAAQIRFAGISQILGVGISVGITALTGGADAVSVESLWQNRGGVLGKGAAIGGILSSLYINPSNYVNSCNLADKIQADAKILSLELKLAHQDYAAARAAAGEAVAARAAVEKQ
jgi:hypothetical protein